ncbi:Ger(x)C family spore germination protein [Paenibacillus sp. GCM10012306]|uniref:Ger(x)C family spore germination protein n=1 Tax=Paenibacillus sp. GCM10012306 TaxID=3317342 RepID=UPI0036114708
MNATFQKLAVAGITLCCLTGCWDRIEINELAVAGLTGSEIDPHTHEQIVYYQIINPGAYASESSSRSKAPVYTYKVQGKTKGGLAQLSSVTLPRKLFTDHYQSHIVTEQYAREGLRTFLNYYERQFNRRSSLYLFVTDSPLSDVMMTYTPLEQLPGRLLRSLISNTNKTTGRISLKSRVKDLVENMESSTFTVLPIISLKGEKPLPSTTRFDEINGNQGNLMLTGAAVFKQDRMIGKISLWENGYYNLLKGQAGNFFESIVLDNRVVDLYAHKIKTKQHLSLIKGVPTWNVEITAHLALRNDEQTEKLTWDNLSKITDQFDLKLIETSQKLYAQAIDKKWDLFGLEDEMKYKRGSAWKKLQQQENGWTETKLNVTIKSKIEDIGEIVDPYKGGAGNGKE